MLLTLFVSLLSMWPIAAASDPAPPLRDGALALIAVDVVAPPEIKQSFVTQVFAEVDAIWRPAGITFTWRRVESRDAASAARLQVAIEHGRMNGAEDHHTLGWITFTGNEPEPSIHLSISTAADLLDARAAVDNRLLTRHGLLIERALGRALSHEIGHYLLGKIHGHRGLMRASWPPQEIFGEVRQGFELTAEQRQSAAARLDRNQEPGFTP